MQIVRAKKSKCPKALANAHFLCVTFTQNPSKIGLTTYKNSIKAYRGVAQLVARDVWDVDAAGSNPVTPTSRQCLHPKSGVVAA